MKTKRNDSGAGARHYDEYWAKQMANLECARHHDMLRAALYDVLGVRYVAWLAPPDGKIQ